MHNQLAQYCLRTTQSKVVHLTLDDRSHFVLLHLKVIHCIWLPKQKKLRIVGLLLQVMHQNKMINGLMWAHVISGYRRAVYHDQIALVICYCKATNGELGQNVIVFSKMHVFISILMEAAKMRLVSDHDHNFKNFFYNVIFIDQVWLVYKDTRFNQQIMLWVRNTRLRSHHLNQNLGIIASVLIRTWIKNGKN